MRKKTTWMLPILAGGLFLSGHDRLDASSFVSEFGTNLGRVTVEDAEFEKSLGAEGTITDLPESVEVARESAVDGFQQFAFSREFDGLGGNHRNDFTIEMVGRFTAFAANQNNERFGIMALGLNPDGTDGISAQIRERSSGGSNISIRSGVNGVLLADERWSAGNVTVDENYRLTLAGTYLEDEMLELTFTFAKFDGSDSQTLTATVDPLWYAGNLFGVSSRIKESSSFEVEVFSVVIGSEAEPVSIELFVSKNGDRYDFRWAGSPAKVYDLVSSTELESSISEWEVYDPDGDGGEVPYGDIAATDGVTILEGVLGQGAKRFFALVEKDPPVSNAGN